MLREGEGRDGRDALISEEREKAEEEKRDWVDEERTEWEQERVCVVHEYDLVCPRGMLIELDLRGGRGGGLIGGGGMCGAVSVVDDAGVGVDTGKLEDVVDFVAGIEDDTEAERLCVRVKNAPI